MNEEIRSVTRGNGFEEVQQSDELPMEESFPWQQELLVNKSQEAADKLETLRAERDQLLKDIDQKNATIEEVKASVRHGEDFKQYVDQLRSKSATFKKMKKNIDELSVEYGVLLKTQQLLEQKLSLASEYVGEDGATPLDTKNNAKNLKELIGGVNVALKEKRCKLAPQLKELKLLQVELQELESKHLEKQHHHMEVQSFLERKVQILEEDITTCSKELEMETHKLNGKKVVIEKLQASISHLNIEKEDGTLSENLTKKVKQQEELMDNLHQRHLKIKEMEHFNSVQMAMMKDLLAILTTKLAIYSSRSKSALFSTTTSCEILDT